MVRFSPDGFLDLTTDPSDLPGEVSGKNETSGAMTRCTNLSLDHPGKAVTRKGSAIVSTATVPGRISHLVEHLGSRYAFTTGNIYQDEASIASGLSGAAWRTLPYNAFNVAEESLFATNGIDKKRITGATVREWGLDAPETPTGQSTLDWAYTYEWEATDGFVSGAIRKITQEHEDGEDYFFAWEEAVISGEASTTGNDTDKESYWFEVVEDAEAVYQVRTTHVRKSADGVLECESNPAEAVVIVPGSSLTIFVPLPSDPQVTHFRFYRTLADGAVFYFADEISHAERVAVGGQYYTFSADDTGLGSEVATDHDRPPDGITALAGPDYNGYLFALVGNKLHFCKAKQPEYWPADYFVEIGPPQFPGKSLTFFNGQLHIWTRNGLSILQGTGFESFFPISMTSQGGVVAADAALAVQGQGVYHLGAEGLYVWTGSADSRADLRFRKIVEGITVENVPGVGSLAQSWLFAWAGKLWFCYASSGIVDNFLVVEIETGRIVHYDYGRTFTAWCIDRTNDRILLADSSGNIWALETGTTDAGTVVMGQIQSKEFADQLRRYFPRFARWDVDGTGTGSVLLEGQVIQTHAIHGRNPKKRHVVGKNGARVALRIDVTGPATVYMGEVD